jgi:hypothetical protein
MLHWEGRGQGARVVLVQKNMACVSHWENTDLYMYMGQAIGNSPKPPTPPLPKWKRYRAVGRTRPVQPNPLSISFFHPEFDERLV